MESEVRATSSSIRYQYPAVDLFDLNAQEIAKTDLGNVIGDVFLFVDIVRQFCPRAGGKISLFPRHANTLLLSPVGGGGLTL